MKRRYKVLPIGFPFNCKRFYWEDCVNEKEKIQPIFNRNGFYLDRYSGKTWLEIDGEAWIYNNKEGFEYELKISEGNNRIHPDVFNAIKVLIHNRLANKHLKEIYRIESDIRGLRLTSLTGMKAGLGLKKRFNKFKDSLRNNNEH